MRSILSCLALMLMLLPTVSAQFIATDWTARDINDQEHNLYDILASGKSVIIDVSATWCGPCWSFHQKGTLHDVMEKYGPDGTDEIMVFFVEGDIATGMEDLLGNTSGSIGNWIEGTNYPILDNAAISNMLGVDAYPTLFRICPDRIVTEISTGWTADQIYQSVTSCPSISSEPKADFYSNQSRGCESLDVVFNDLTWPRADEYTWDFGDGNTSSEMEPTHTYDSPGQYEVKLTVKNEFGTNEKVVSNYVKVGNGGFEDIANVGAESKDVGSGRYFEGGHQALIFDVNEDMILHTVKVYSDKPDTRVIVLSDETGNLIRRREVWIEEGEHRIEINFDIPKGKNYQLGLHSDAYMWRNDGGATYPYEISNLVSIHSSTAGTEPLRYYYYFYDWEVSSAICSDDMVNVIEIDNESFTMSPNPASNLLKIETNISEKYDLSIYNMLGELVLRKNQINGEDLVDVRDLESGIHVVKISSENHKYVSSILITSSL